MLGQLFQLARRSKLRPKFKLRRRVWIRQRVQLHFRAQYQPKFKLHHRSQLSTHSSAKSLGTSKTRSLILLPSRKRRGGEFPQYGAQAAKLIARAQEEANKRVAWEAKKKVQQAKKKFQLMKLPFEVRLNILDFAVDAIDIPVFHNGRRFKHPIALPPVARTRDQQLNLEGLIVTIEKTSFSVHNRRALEGFETWLSEIDLTKLNGATSYKTGFDAVKTLSFEGFDYYEAQMMKRQLSKRTVRCL